MQAGDRDLGGGYQEQLPVPGRGTEQIALELGKLARAFEGGARHEIGRQHLAVASLPRMDVEHELDQGALEACPLPPENGETGTRDAGCPFEIEDSQLHTQVPVGLGLEVEAGWLTHPTDFDVGALVGPDGHRAVRDVGQEHQDAAEPLLHIVLLLLQKPDALRHGLHLGLERCSVSTGSSEPGDLLAAAPLLMPQPLDLLDGCLAPAVEGPWVDILDAVGTQILEALSP